MWSLSFDHGAFLPHRMLMGGPGSDRTPGKDRWIATCPDMERRSMMSRARSFGLSSGWAHRLLAGSNVGFSLLLLPVYQTGPGPGYHV